MEDSDLIYKSYKLRIYPTLAQRRQLEVEFKACRFAWNWLLGRKINYYRFAKLKVNAVALSRELTLLKDDNTLLKKGSATAQNNVLWDLDEAYKKFFRKEAKFPKFKKRARQSCTYQLNKKQGKNIFGSGRILQLPKLGKLRVKWSREVPSFPEYATVSKNAAGQYFVSLCCKHPLEYKVKAQVDKIPVGIDMGLTTLMTLSTGEKIENRRYLKKGLRKLKIVQRKLSKCKDKKGSNRRKCRHAVARIHLRIGNQRNNHCHQVSTSIVNKCSLISMESLGVGNMLKNRRLARAIADCGWYELKRQIQYKAKWSNCDVVEIGRFEPTSKVCFECGYKVAEMALSVRHWRCPDCGSEHDRDVNAAKNILRLGFETYREERGRPHEGECLWTGT